MVGDFMEELLISIGTAALAGGIYGLVGYFKNKKQDDLFEGFDSKMFFVSVAGAAIIGGIASYQGVTPDAISSGLIGPFIFQFLRKVYDTVTAKK